MGLSSSQARLLNLTARMHQIEYKAARLEAMKLQMANESRQVYEDYLNALDKTKIQRKTLTPDGSITYVDITTYSELVAAGFKLKATDGSAAVCENMSEVQNHIPGFPAGETLADNTTSITNLINSGYFVLYEYNRTDDLKDTSVSTNTSLQEVTDEINLKKEEAKYEAAMKRIDMKDRKYDSDLAALDAERNAIKQEMETLKTVARDNVERTFKLFS